MSDVPVHPAAGTGLNQGLRSAPCGRSGAFGPFRPFGCFGGLARATVLAAALVGASGHAAQMLPPEVHAVLQRAGVPDDAMSVALHNASTGQRVLHWQALRAFNPASLTKLLTTAAALDRLGPAFVWSTPVWTSGTLQGGVLDGSVFIKGQGDPKLVQERVWLLLRKLQQQGVRDIRGDIVLDQSAFNVPDEAPGDFDGEALRPYNVKPAALLMNFRSAVYTFTPDTATGVARVALDPPLAGLQADRTVPLATSGGCGDWRGALKASLEPMQTRFLGSYPAACGERAWPLADPQPATYELRMLDALWREMGGSLRGTVREGMAPADQRPLFEVYSPALTEVLRDINKHSNNMMAQQLFLTLALRDNPKLPATPEAARALLTRWLVQRTGEVRRLPPSDDGDAGGPDLVIDNGSGLSRQTRISAQRLARLLLQVYDSPVMSELMSSLPISGVDGTLARSRATPGRAHLKTGSLRDVAAVAGYVLSNSGRRYVLVASINHANANAARPALDALVQWALRDAPSR